MSEPVATGAPKGEPLSLYRRIDRLILLVNRWVLIVGLALMSIIIFIAVVLRYTVGHSVPWAEEVARYLMLWTTFVGLGPVFRVGGHIAVDTLESALSSQGARILRGIVVAITAGFLVYLIWQGFQYLGRTRLQTTPVTNVSFAWVAASLPVGFLLTLWHIGAVVSGFVSNRKFDATGEVEAVELGGL